jgi:hypothetical protein
MMLSRTLHTKEVRLIGAIITDLVLSPFLEDRLDVSLLPVTWEQFQSE